MVERLFSKPNYATRWSLEDFELLETALKEGRPIPEIAKAMGRSQEAVRCKAWEGGLLPRRKKSGVSVGSA